MRVHQAHGNDARQQERNCHKSHSGENEESPAWPHSDDKRFEYSLRGYANGGADQDPDASYRCDVSCEVPPKMKARGAQGRSNSQVSRLPANFVSQESIDATRRDQEGHDENGQGINGRQPTEFEPADRPVQELVHRQHVDDVTLRIRGAYPVSCCPDHVASL